MAVDVGLTTIFSGGGIGLLLLTLVEVGALFGIVAGVAYVIWPALKWPYMIPKYGFRNGVQKYLGMDYGKIVYDGNVQKLLIWKSKRKVEPPPNEYKIAFTGKRDVVPYFVDNAGNMSPLKLEPGGHSLRPNDKDIDFWAIQELKEAQKDYNKKSLLLEYLPIIATATFLIFVFIFMLILTKQLGDLVQALGQLTSALTAAV